MLCAQLFMKETLHLVFSLFQDLDDSSSSSSDDSIYEDVAEDVKAESKVPEAGNDLEHELEEEDLNPEDVKVPPQALKEAAARFPPFWRVNDHLRSVLHYLLGDLISPGYFL